MHERDGHTQTHRQTHTAWRHRPRLCIYKIFIRHKAADSIARQKSYFSNVIGLPPKCMLVWSVHSGVSGLWTFTTNPSAIASWSHRQRHYIWVEMVRLCRESPADWSSARTTHQHYNHGLRAAVRPGVSWLSLPPPSLSLSCRSFT